MHIGAMLAITRLQLITIYAVTKEPPDTVTKLPIIIGEMIPPINAPMLITEKEEPIILLETNLYGNII